MLAVFSFLAAAAASATPAADDAATVSQLDIAYQAAVKRNDAEAMARILDDNFVLVVGTGTAFSRNDLLDTARSGKVVYVQQDEEPGSQTVRLYGNTAVVTAKLWLKGTSQGQTFERKLWFSDTYVRRPKGWRYVFGQASLPLPPETAQ
jgi:ketosteroid isomerase-like protein